MRYSFYIFVAAACISSIPLVSAAPVLSSSSDSASRSTFTLAPSRSSSTEATLTPTRKSEDKYKRAQSVDSAESGSGSEDLDVLAPEASSLASLKSWIPRTIWPRESFAQLTERYRRIVQQQRVYGRQSQHENGQILSAYHRLMKFQNEYIATRLPDSDPGAAAERENFRKKRKEDYTRYLDAYHKLSQKRYQFQHHREQDWKQLEQRAEESRSGQVTVLAFPSPPGVVGLSGVPIVPHVPGSSVFPEIPELPELPYIFPLNPLYHINM